MTEAANLDAIVSIGIWLQNRTMLSKRIHGICCCWKSSIFPTIEIPKIILKCYQFPLANYIFTKLFMVLAIDIMMLLFLIKQ